jgi:hypothetical protein
VLDAREVTNDVGSQLGKKVGTARFQTLVTQLEGLLVITCQLVKSLQNAIKMACFAVSSLAHRKSWLLP